MSATASRWAWQVPEHYPELSPGAHHVLLCLADRFNARSNSAWPSHADICKRTNLSDRTVRRHLDELAELGLIERRARLNARHRKIGTTYCLPLLDHAWEREKEGYRFGPDGASYDPEIDAEQKAEERPTRRRPKTFAQQKQNNMLDLVECIEREELPAITTGEGWSS